MITFYALTNILAIHWIYDFFLQTHYQATQKSKCNIALASHVLVYTIGLICMAILNHKLFPSVDWIITWVLLNSVLHFLTDYMTSRASSLLWKEGKMHDFFAMVGLDQFIHYFTLFGTFIWMTQQ
jgi:hypothetical protein